MTNPEVALLMLSLFIVMILFGDKWAVTPSDVNVGEWNSHIPGMVKYDILDENHRFPNQFDAVILSEVLEHVINPGGALNSAQELLCPGGILIVSVPFMYRIHEYGGDDTETSEPGLKDYWRFTPHGLTELITRQKGFEAFWVGRLVKDDIKTFPQFFCPEGVVALPSRETVQESPV